MPTVPVRLVKTEDRSYEIVIEKGLLERLPGMVHTLIGAHSYALITDSNVEPLYAAPLLEGFKREGLEAHIISFPAGEAHKTRETKAMVEDLMSQLGMGRDSAVVAIGGGVAGDLASYIAATYTRGLPYVQVPTTIVACVDSSVGGKTGVDTPYGKNLIGAFYQPRAVYADISTLATLPPEEVRNGLAEVIKYGVIRDGALFSMLEGKMPGIIALDDGPITRIVQRSCEIKAEIVEQDERESNLRKVLNFGHTVGHAIENLSGYSMRHGEAISIGMVVEGGIAASLGLWDPGCVERLAALLEAAGLPVAIPPGLDTERAIGLMKLDKKARRGLIEMALPSGIGTMATRDGSYGISVGDDEVRRALLAHA